MTAATGLSSTTGPRPKTDRNGDLVCPMAGCGEPLLLTFTQALALDATTMASDQHMTAADAHTGDWKVECLSGHVLLLPDPHGCLCDPEDQQTEECPHDPDEYEWSEDGPMAFRGNDRKRLVAVIERLGGLEPGDQQGER